jgi:hypothetical protein
MKVKTVITGVGARIVELIKEGKLSNKEILEVVRAEHPLRKTTYACVAWYQTKLKKEADPIKEQISKMSLEELLG